MEVDMQRQQLKPKALMKMDGSLETKVFPEIL